VVESLIVVFSGESLDRIRRIVGVKGFVCDFLADAAIHPFTYKLDPLFGLWSGQLYLWRETDGKLKFSF
jgi:hypothetical protein